MTLDGDDIEAIAQRVAQLVADQAPVGPPRKMTVAQVADELGVSPDWVRDHAADMRAVRLGHPRNGELRFDRHDVDQYIDRHRLQPTRQPARRATPGPLRGVSRKIPERVADW